MLQKAKKKSEKNLAVRFECLLTLDGSTVGVNRESHVFVRECEASAGLGRMSVLKDVSKLKHLLELFPLRNEISYCFAYGSAVFEQKLAVNVEAESANSSEKNDGRKMIDLVLAVDNPVTWHQENLAKNWSHYSGLRYLGAGTIAKIQQHFGAKIFYNTLIPVGDEYIKYGVISTKDLVNDLLDWETFYISGRLHKPTLVLQQSQDNSDLTNALEINLQSALHAALLLLQEKFSEEELYLTIAGLSYSGDFRMRFGEDRNKVEKIVRPQIRNFRSIYFPLLESDAFANLVHWSIHRNKFIQTCSPNAIQWHLNMLPKTVQHYLSKEWIAENTTTSRLRNSAYRMDIDDLMRRLAFDITYRKYVKNAIEAVVFRSSSTQSIKGIFTAGLSKSIIYSAEKINKMFKGFGEAKKGSKG